MSPFGNWTPFCGGHHHVYSHVLLQLHHLVVAWGHLEPPCWAIAGRLRFESVRPGAKMLRIEPSSGLTMNIKTSSGSRFKPLHAWRWWWFRTKFMCMYVCMYVYIYIFEGIYCQGKEITPRPSQESSSLFFTGFMTWLPVIQNLSSVRLPLFFRPFAGSRFGSQPSLEFTGLWWFVQTSASVSKIL